MHPKVKGFHALKKYILIIFREILSQFSQTAAAAGSSQLQPLALNFTNATPRLFSW